MQLDDTICYCFHISKRKIVNYVRIHKPRVASQISDCGGAGSGCGWCVPFLKKYFQSVATDGAEGADDLLTPEEYARQRGAYIREGGGVPPSGAIPPPEA